MRTREVSAVEYGPRRSKYGRGWTTMVGTLEKHGPDGKLRALVGTERWTASTAKRWRLALRDYAKRHAPAGVRLSLRICARNGLVFTWLPKVGKRRGRGRP